MELERAENVLVICHQAVARCILGYFLDKQAGMYQISDKPILFKPVDFSRGSSIYTSSIAYSD